MRFVAAAAAAAGYDCDECYDDDFATMRCSFFVPERNEHTTMFFVLFNIVVSSCLK